MADETLTRRPVWGLFVLGVFTFLLGPLLFLVQLQMRQFVLPWHVPLLGTLGVLLMLASVLRRRGWVRVLLLAGFSVVCGFQWYFLTVKSKVPAYAGPIQVGEKLPVFSAKRADGTPFGNTQLENGQTSVLVFFRGRWCAVCMAEIGELNERAAEFKAAKAQVVAISNDSVDVARLSQNTFPELVIVSDADQKVARMVGVIHPGAAPDGKDTNAPTIFLLDSKGVVQEILQQDNFFARFSAGELIERIRSRSSSS